MEISFEVDKNITPEYADKLRILKIIWQHERKVDMVWKVISQAERRMMERKDNEHMVWRMKNILEEDWEIKGMRIRPKWGTQARSTQECKVRLYGARNKDKLYAWRKAFYLLTMEGGTAPMLYEMMKHEDGWAIGVLEQMWELYPEESNTIVFRKWLVRQVGCKGKKEKEEAVLAGHFRGEKVSIEGYLRKWNEKWITEQMRMDEVEKVRRSPRIKQRQAKEIRKEEEENKRSKDKNDKEAAKTRSEKDEIRTENDEIRKHLEKYEDEKWEEIENTDENEERKKKIKRINQQRNKNKKNKNTRNREEEFEYQIKCILKTTYIDNFEARTVREVLEAVIGSDIGDNRRKNTIVRWRKALEIVALEKGAQFMCEVMLEDMRGDFRRPDGGYDAPTLSKTLMKTVWGTEYTAEVEAFRTKMVTALLNFESSAKGNSPGLEVMKAQYDDDKHGFRRKMQEGIKIHTRKLKEKKEREAEELKKKQDKEHEQEKRRRTVIGRSGMVAPQAKPKDEKQETPNEKKKRLSETKIRRTVLDTRQIRDKIAEMLGTKRTTDAMAFRFLLIHTEKETLMDTSPRNLMKVNRNDPTMIKLWRRVIPRRIHNEGGIYMRQALFALRIEKEIQPLWDTMPENKETIRFRKIMSHFIVKKVGTQRDNMMKRRWNEGFETPEGQKEATGPHALLTYVAGTTQRRQREGIARRIDREKRDEEFRKLYKAV